MTMQGPKFGGAVGEAADVAVDMLFVPVFQDDMDHALGRLPGLSGAARQWISDARTSGEFRAKAYEFLIIPVESGWKARRVALVGCGKRTDLTPERLRKVAASCGYTARLRAVKDKLAANLRGTALYDIGQFTRHIEHAYTRMIELQYSGQAPDHINVAR